MKHSSQQTNYSIILVINVILLSFCFLLSDIFKSCSEQVHFIRATSINYGISQQPITDMSQLMPKLCQNQSVICEGSYCIPGIRKCVCDLRMPVQFGRFCLRQVDIETQCFVTNQCNHTIRDAVCIDVNSNSILNAEGSKFKLDQWQQLNELRQQSAQSKDVPIKKYIREQNSDQRRFMYVNEDRFNYGRREDVLKSNLRNSPYEINYNTPELLAQNHTRRRTNSSESRSFFDNNYSQQSSTKSSISSVDEKPSTTTTGFIIANSDSTTQTTSTLYSQTNADSVTFDNLQTSTTTVQIDTASNDQKFQVTSTTSPEHSSRKKMVVKSLKWPPGVCSCPHGFMFDSMLRKCLAVSLSDSHCQVDLDCKQIPSTHCSMESKKCECDEPLDWDQKELSCVRVKPTPRPDDYDQNRISSGGGIGFVENLIPPLVLAKLFPDYIILLMVFIVLIIFVTLLLFKITAKWFSSSSSSILISPKSKKKKNKNASNNLPPRSPYATLRRPDHKPSSQLSNFTQATRGRILNYDFEQESTKDDLIENSRSPQPTSSNTNTSHKATVKDNKTSGTLKSLSSNKGHRHQNNSPATKQSNNYKPEESFDDQLLELNDNISISQLESESKSDDSILAIPGPPPTQQPPYMMASAMKGQGSAIAAAAAAVANKRMQKKNLEQQQQQQPSGKLANGSPVFL